MHIIAVDDDLSALEALERAIRMAAPDVVVACFDAPAKALDYAEQHRIDVAFLDIDMCEMNGLFLAKHLKAQYAGTNIIFVTAYMQYASNAFAMHASGYVEKPINPLRVRAELDDLRHPLDDGVKMVDRVGPYALDYATRQVFLHGQDTLLTPREFAIFHFLANHPNTFFVPHELYKNTFGQDANGDLRSLYQNISRLRKRLNLNGTKAAGGLRIEQKRGKGYRLTVPAFIAESPGRRV